ncbi:uncharacterized protein [Rutidosis leptorrhynchoides]|uniref:uncharacterized protein n=1 Tax=Rutidosis leptorrhynchoides TaxID=125765 RepID=UPI003A991E49
MVGPQFPQFDFQRAEQKSMGTTSLDMRRAESSRQHVRALNNQFARSVIYTVSVAVIFHLCTLSMIISLRGCVLIVNSWVQSQLQNHPDELWEDGVRDYLTHASNILEKFSDVVSWLKLNSTKGENSLEHAAQKKLVTENKENNTNVFIQEKTMNAPPSATTPSIFGTSGFSNSFSTGPVFNTQSPFSFGGQSTMSVKTDAAAKDADGDDEIEQPSSPSLKKTEETGILVVHEVKCKLYVKSTDPTDKDAWKDRGTGQLSIKCKEGVAKGNKDSKPTILVRNDVGRILLNALLYPGIKTSLQKNSIVAIFHTADDNASENSNVVARTFLIRTKSVEDRDKLAAVIQEYAPTA